MTFDYAIGIHDELPKRPGPWIETDPPPHHEPCEPCRRHYAAELARWSRIANGLADADDLHRRNTERLTADLANALQANAALRRTIDRVRHYDDDPQGDAS